MTTSVPVAATDLTRLDRLAPHTCALVREMDTENDDMERLKILGVCVGRQVEVSKAGDPLILKVFGSRLGLSASLAARVWVEPCVPGHCSMREHPCT